MLARTARAARHVRSISTSSAVRSVNAAGGNTASAAKHSTPAPDPEALHGKDLFLAVASVGALTAAGIYVWEARREKIDTKDDKYAENLEEIDGAYNAVASEVDSSVGKAAHQVNDEFKDAGRQAQKVFDSTVEAGEKELEELIAKVKAALSK